VSVRWPSVDIAVLIILLCSSQTSSDCVGSSRGRPATSPQAQHQHALRGAVPHSLHTAKDTYAHFLADSDRASIHAQARTHTCVPLRPCREADHGAGRGWAKEEEAHELVALRGGFKNTFGESLGEVRVIASVRVLECVFDTYIHFLYLDIQKYVCLCKSIHVDVYV